MSKSDCARRIHRKIITHKKNEQKRLHPNKPTADKYNLKVEELECDSGQIQVYPPGSFIEPHSDKDYEGNLKVCAVLIPLNSRPENANGGELVIGDYEYVPNKGDIITITMDTDTLHQVNHVKDWFRFVLTILVKEKL